MTLTSGEHTYQLVSRFVSEREYADYMRACLTGNTAVEKGLERYLAAFFINRGTWAIPPEIFEEFVIPLLPVKGRVFRPVVAALSNFNCPPDILMMACCTNKDRYMQAAALNPNCPEEGRIIYALTPDVPS